jgi:hypothetical protein
MLIATVSARSALAGPTSIARDNTGSGATWVATSWIAVDGTPAAGTPALGAATGASAHKLDPMNAVFIATRSLVLRSGARTRHA